MRDELGPLHELDICRAFSHTGRPAEAPAQLALITVMQFAEGLSDAQAADAVRARIDWKYALALDLTDPGFDASVLSEFRQRLITGHAELLLFETMLPRFQEQGCSKRKGANTLTPPMLGGHPDAQSAGVHRRNAASCAQCAGHRGAELAPVLGTRGVVRSLPPAVCRLSLAARKACPLHSCRANRDRRSPTTGSHLRPRDPDLAAGVPAIRTLRQVWLQQFYATAAEQPVRWRTAEDLPPAPLLISSPYDPEARYGKKRETEWTGYKVHVTETCDDETPNLITDVTTTPATTSDFAVLPTIQMHLATRQMTPGEQLVDAGYVTSDHLLTSRGDHGIDLIGPTASDQSWQGQTANGFAAAQFVIDWDAKRATCPQGQQSVVWMERPDRHGHATVRIAFSKPVCGACASRADCTRAATAPGPYASVSGIITPPFRPRGRGNRRQHSRRPMPVAPALRGRLRRALERAICDAHAISGW